MLLFALTILVSNYFSPIGARSPIIILAVTPGPCPASLTSLHVNSPDIELSQWSGSPLTPVGFSGCGFDINDVACAITSPSANLIAVTPAFACSISGGNVLGSFTIAAGASTGPNVVIVTGYAGPGLTNPVDSASAFISVAFLSTTLTTSSTTTTTFLSTSYSTLTTSTNFFTSLTTTTLSSTGRSTEVDTLYSVYTQSGIQSALSTLSTTVTSTTLSLSTTTETTTQFLFSPTTTSGFIVRPVQNYYSDAVGLLAVLLLCAPLVLRRILT